VAAPRPRPRVRVALLVAAVLGAFVVVGALRLHPTGAGPGIDLASAGRAAVGSGDAGQLADPRRRAGCLRAVRAPGVDPAAGLLGSSRLDLAGRPGLLLVLTSGRRGVFHVVVVDPDCGPAGGTLLGSTTAGGR
jgi:hypothetical protein